MSGYFYTNLPFFWYLAGSLCFVVGSVIVLWRAIPCE